MNITFFNCKITSRMKRLICFILILSLSSSCFAHEYNHYAELFSQILLPIVLLGCLICLPLSFLLIISKFDKKISRLLYLSYVLIALGFFSILKFFYSYVHNHFELTCQVIAVGLYLSILSFLIYLTKLILFHIKRKK